MFIVIDQICLHCGACVGACPTNSMFLHETSAVEILPTCTRCGLCADVCPVGAIWETEEQLPPRDFYRSDDSKEIRQ